MRNRIVSLYAAVNEEIVFVGINTGNMNISKEGKLISIQEWGKHGFSYIPIVIDLETPEARSTGEGVSISETPPSWGETEALPGTLLSEYKAP